MTEIMYIIECALALAGLDIAEVGDDYLLVRDAGRDESFRLEISEHVGGDHSDCSHPLRGGLPAAFLCDPWLLLWR